ncbi:MAG: heavy metal translocating P-type ATPase, partial [Oculatellaceae cyanobacterium bins.114]|nr:heavy metal translocating P-type ATPase [Oculatellaceae cyanobacterium bins.114]
MTQTPSLKTQQMQVGGMDCSSCAMKIEGSVEKLPGIAEVSVNVATGRMVVSYDPQEVSEVEIQNRVTRLGYTVAIKQSRTPTSSHTDDGHDQDDGHDHNHSHGTGEFNLKKELPAVVLAVSLFAIGIIFEEPLHNTPYNIGEFAVFIPAYLLSGWSVLKTAGRNILRGQIFDENFLMTIATLGAFAIHQLPEAVAVMLFFKVGELFQEYSVGRSRRSIKALLEVRPDSATLKVNGTVKQVKPETVNVGDQILVKPGEKVPLDGEILEGNSQVDTSALTGESVPRIVNVGDPILAGMINKSGA